ncbi:MAG: D-glycero-beta-D-manno-heptose 1,7-bisphosphate 7-phosphatase [Desulfobulbaceae bacterium]|uniref:D,D-heptose 1,7-bisphosphate phosphatase n=1 Tax=Candidatus Desulfatifera sulfidica TaxID=2841691 RepID=A0A8J6N9A1_9BACT|nr:D-glycero-beta-D-manno-heptose 1,7-bisphosphate 7-phosphatase [Candidatus Desulfatifera sulfidica]
MTSEGQSKRAAVFLDRDGTINEQMGYINHLSRFQMLPGAAQAIRQMNEAGLVVVVVSNQSGLARGYFPDELLTAVHEKMTAELSAAGAHVDGLYFCPHHPEAKRADLRIACDCRKPKPGLVLQAAEELNIDLSRSFMVGDRWSDLKCAVNSGVTPILVLTGYGRGDADYIGPEQKVQPAFVGEDLSAVADWILEQLR